MALAGFEPASPACEPPQTHALVCAPTAIGLFYISNMNINPRVKCLKLKLGTGRTKKVYDRRIQEDSDDAVTLQ